MIKQALDELFSTFPYEADLTYSGKFKPYRANVRLHDRHIQFNLSKKWKAVSPEIQAGLIQELALRILKKRVKPLKQHTESIELYHTFIKKLHLGIPKTQSDPLLEQSFNSVNELYFSGFMEMPNLTWADSITKLGSYEYASDLITISTLLRDDAEALDYVMYHEMLHKKHKFHAKNGRSHHHTHEFREDEQRFRDAAEVEKRLNRLVRKKKGGFLSLFQ